MKKWYFSKGGEVSGPLDLPSAKKFIENKSDYYGWHPSFRSWKPVTMIGEFSDVVKAAAAPSQVPKELINEFNLKKRQLNEKLSAILEGLKETHTIKTKLKKKITIYKELTENLSDDFKSAIESVEQQYVNFTKRIVKLEEAAEIARGEIAEVVNAFEQRVANKDTGLPKASLVIEEEPKPEERTNVKVRKFSTTTEDDSAVVTEPKVSKVAEQEVKEETSANKPARRIVVDTKVSEPIKASKADEDISNEARSASPRVTKISTSTADIPVRKENIKPVAEKQEVLKANPPINVAKITSLSEEEGQEQESFTGVKGLFKSVFKSSAPAPKLSTQLKQSVMNEEAASDSSSVENEDDNVVELKSPQNEHNDADSLHDDEAEKNKRLRRRRRRR